MWLGPESSAESFSKSQLWHSIKWTKQGEEKCVNWPLVSLNVARRPQNVAHLIVLIVAVSFTRGVNGLLLLSWKCNPSILFPTLSDADWPNFLFVWGKITKCANAQNKNAKFLNPPSEIFLNLLAYFYTNNHKSPTVTSDKIINSSAISFQLCSNSDALKVLPCPQGVNLRPRKLSWNPSIRLNGWQQCPCFHTVNGQWMWSTRSLVNSRKHYFWLWKETMCIKSTTVKHICCGGHYFPCCAQDDILIKFPSHPATTAGNHLLVLSLVFCVFYLLICLFICLLTCITFLKIRIACKPYFSITAVWLKITDR